MSRIVELPEILPYPEIVGLKHVQQLRNRIIYVIEEYGTEGLAMLVSRQDGDVFVRLAAFDGRVLDAEDPGDIVPVVEEVMKKYSHRIVATMKYVGIPNAIFYWAFGAEGPLLVDVRVSLNKFCSPGYLRDFIGRQEVPIQKVAAGPMVLDDSLYGKMISGEEMYGRSSFIIKPSVFKHMERDGAIVPVYGRTSPPSKLSAEEGHEAERNA